MKKVLLASCVFFAVQGNAQVNLVPNPSFEDTVACPASSDISFATGWFNCNFYSPDYYNSCANSSASSLGVPCNWLGCQPAMNGNAYAGIIIWYTGVREYLGIQLTQTLVPGTRYFVSAYISRADSAEVAPYTCASNNFGFRFSTFPYNQSNPVVINNFSHWSTDSIITDVTSWTKVEGSFIADSNYQFLTIGNFYDDQNTDTINCGYTLAYAYYYLDGICVSTDSLCQFDTGIWHPPIENSLDFIYPNPADHSLSIINAVEGASFIITDVRGKTILTGVSTQSTESIDVSVLADGFYFLVTQNSKHKFIVNHQNP